MNYLGMLYDLFKPFLDGEKKPLNTLEVSNIWMYTVMGDSTLRLEEIWINTAQDNELRETLKDIYATHKEIVADLKKFLLNEGVPLPKVYSPKPLGDYRSISEGARYTDREIANLMSYNLVVALTHGVRVLSESIRADIGLMFSKFLIQHLSVAIPLKELMIKRDWLQEPPPFMNQAQPLGSNI
ncbi:DUF3231 family protein [Anoxybacteroides tepidamans]|uniref:DUF3231 family protein n=1 Tax=Anoxybacteroides tepidamans TaxID=265948 RepID=UPI000487A8BB|nr:DUF3231 family protein [Anoxybacillus tepidamans]